MVLGNSIRDEIKAYGECISTLTNISYRKGQTEEIRLETVRITRMTERNVKRTIVDIAVIVSLFYREEVIWN